MYIFIYTMAFQSAVGQIKTKYLLKPFVAPIFTYMETSSDYTGNKGIAWPSSGYVLSFCSSLARFGRLGEENYCYLSYCIILYYHIIISGSNCYKLK